MKRIAFTAMLLLAALPKLFAQPGHFNCGHSHASEKLLQAHPEILDWERAQDEFIQHFMESQGADRFDTTRIYTIPVVFHIIHQYGPENISNQNIYDQMAILNRDYRKLNGDTISVAEPFQSIIADCRIQFKLATIDPLGNCTNGIDRIANTQTYVGNDGSKLGAWPRQKYLNVWIINDMENGVAGYAYYPSAVADPYSNWIDGVIIRYDYIGSLPPSSVGTSRALTHEIGHWLELQHTWGSTNDPTVACGDDLVQDTPETKGHDNCNNRYDFYCDTHTLPTGNEGLYTFDGMTANLGTTDTTAAFASDDQLIFNNAQAHGVSNANLTDGRFEFSNWGIGAADGETSYSNLSGTIDLTKYYEITIQSKPGINFSPTGIKFDVSRNDTGARTFAVRTSANNFNTSIPATIASSNELASQNGNVIFIKNDGTTSITNTTFNFVGSSYQNIINDAITIRIYGWNAEDNSGSFAIDNFQVIGTYGTVENVENYMEYSYCSKMFTKGQQQRMEAALNSEISMRNNLWSDANLAATGTDGIHDLVCAPTADFYPAEKMTCVNTNVQFFDLSGDAEATAWSWSFQDGTPSTSSQANPLVSFSQPGWKTVTLTVSNAIGSTSMTQNFAILVSPEWSEVNGLLHEDCSVNPLDNSWSQINPNNNTSVWGYTQAAGYGDNHGCFYLNEMDLQPSLFNKRGDDKDELITPSMDLTALSGGTLNFKYAYATAAVNTSDLTETLEIYSTKNCGQTWTLRATLSGLDLVTDGSNNSTFVPTSNLQWNSYSMPIPATLEDNQVRFKFVFNSSDFSNNLYLDNINIDGSLGVDAFGNKTDLKIYPNPTSDELNIRGLDAANAIQRIRILDVTGQVVKEANFNHTASELIKLDISSLPDGVYFIQAYKQVGLSNETFVKVSH